MAKKKEKNPSKLVCVKGTAKFRKQLRSACRRGGWSVVHLVSKNLGFPILARRGVNFHVLADGFGNSETAMAWAERKLDITPLRFVGGAISKFAA